MWAWGRGVCERAAGGEPGSDWYQRPEGTDTRALGCQTWFSGRHSGAAAVTSYWLFCPTYVELYPCQSLCILQIVQANMIFFSFSTRHPSALSIFRSCAHVCALGWMSWTMTGRRLCTWPVVWGVLSLSELCWGVVLSVTLLVVLATPFTVLWSTARSGKCISRWVGWLTTLPKYTDEQFLPFWSLCRDNIAGTSQRCTSKEHINLPLLLGDLRNTLVSLDNCLNVV